RIIVDGYSYLEKKQRRYDAKGYVAIVFQHELDHLDGKLFIDRIDRKQPWNKRDNMDLL
ncbi:peptide deformylase, partial [Mycoplasmopsis pullorum]